MGWFPLAQLFHPGSQKVIEKINKSLVDDAEAQLSETEKKIVLAHYDERFQDLDVKSLSVFLTVAAIAVTLNLNWGKINEFIVFVVVLLGVVICLANVSTSYLVARLSAKKVIVERRYKDEATIEANNRAADAEARLVVAETRVSELEEALVRLRTGSDKSTDEADHD